VATARPSRTSSPTWRCRPRRATATARSKPAGQSSWEEGRGNAALFFWTPGEGTGRNQPPGSGAGHDFAKAPATDGGGTGGGNGGDGGAGGSTPQPISGLKLTLKKGKKVLAKLNAGRLFGTKTLTMKLPKRLKLKKGKYALAATGTVAGVVRTAVLSFKVKR
jgi:hypothetical protein